MFKCQSSCRCRVGLSRSAARIKLRIYIKGMHALLLKRAGVSSRRGTWTGLERTTEIDPIELVVWEMVQLLVVKIGDSRCCCEICSIGAVREVVQLVGGTCS